MTQYNSVNVQLSESQHNRLKAATKNETRVTFETIITYDW